MKKVIGILICLTLIVNVAGCGNTSTPTALASYPEDSHDTEAIESDELTESVQQKESNVNTNVQSVLYGSGNYEDYWEGDDYFDLISYMRDNGFIDAIPTDLMGDIIKDGSKPSSYWFYNDDRSWEIVTDGFFIRTRTNGIAYLTHKSVENPVVIDEYGKKMDAGAIKALDIVVQKIKSNPSETNPLSYTELEYEEN